METIIINDNATAIYATGGGILTQSFPTCYRTFHERVVCAPGQESLWTEWTVKERNAWEKNPPEPAVRDRLTEAVEALWYKGQYGDSPNRAVLNEATGYYELNGLRDVTRQQMLDIWEAGPIMPYMAAGWYYGNERIRTHLCHWRAGTGYGPYEKAYWACRGMEVANPAHGQWAPGMFYNCQKLKAILRNAWYGGTVDGHTFEFCYALEDIPAGMGSRSTAWGLGWSSKLTPQSLTNLVTHCVAAGTESKHATLTLHADAFARLTEEHLATAAERYIDIVTP